MFPIHSRTGRGGRSVVLVAAISLANALAFGVLMGHAGHAAPRVTAEDLDGGATSARVADPMDAGRAEKDGGRAQGMDGGVKAADGGRAQGMDGGH
jgi:hypothetical protein